MQQMSDLPSDSQAIQSELHIPEKVENAPKANGTGADVQFLLEEYDRLKGLAASNWKIYYERFNFFMTVALGSTAAYVALLTADPPVIPQTYPLPDLLVVVIIVWGGFTFLDLTELSYGTLHLVNAIRDIQKYFTERSPHLKEYLYFEKSEIYEAPNKIERFVSRWIFAGSPKLVLAVLDSGLIAILVARFLWWLKSPIELIIACPIIAFAISGLLHMVYVKFAYRRKYITP